MCDWVHSTRSHVSHSFCDQHIEVCRKRRPFPSSNIFTSDNTYTVSQYLYIVYKLQYQVGRITNIEMSLAIPISQCFSNLLYGSDKFATLSEPEHMAVCFGVVYHSEDEFRTPGYTDTGITTFAWETGRECGIMCCLACIDDHDCKYHEYVSGFE